jgi:hypothetical protein
MNYKLESNVFKRDSQRFWGTQDTDTRAREKEYCLKSASVLVRTVKKREVERGDLEGIKVGIRT